MEFLIVSGLSGGGKSRAADVLEDLDFYCVDNMPTALLTKFAELCLATRGRYEKGRACDGHPQSGELFRAVCRARGA
ncbi:MAG: RNase adapter RapZ [Oscillospiraceae bacterium]